MAEQSYAIGVAQTNLNAHIVDSGGRMFRVAIFKVVPN